jgi:putative two-component system response regulator
MKIVFLAGEAEMSEIKSAIEDEYKYIPVQNTDRLIKLAERLRPDLILIRSDGDFIWGFLETISNDPHTAGVPVILATAEIDGELAARAFDCGVSDIISPPFIAPIIKKRIATFIEADEKIRDSQSSLRHIQNSLISVIAELVEDRDKVTGGHIERTQQYLQILVEELQKSGVYADEIADWDLSLLLPSAQLHDVGKITVSDLILNKPGKLSDEEFAVIQSHAAEGERIINEIMNKTKDDGFLLHAKKFAGYHHEKWNGTGYPHKLSGTDIPLEGRIMAIADVYDALVSERPYKKPFSHEKAIEIILGDAGTHFDPLLAEVFARVSDDFWVQSMVGDGKTEILTKERSPVTYAPAFTNKALYKDPPATYAKPENAAVNAPIAPQNENTPVNIPTAVQNENTAANTSTAANTPTGSGRFILGIAGTFKDIVIPLENSAKTVFGRGKFCTIMFPGQVPGISAIHCSIEMQGSDITLIDHNSTFGTFINGRKVEPINPQILKTGDEIWLGSQDISFRILPKSDQHSDPQKTVAVDYNTTDKTEFVAEKNTEYISLRINDNTAQVYNIPLGSEIYIGRDADCTLKLDDKSISHRQCKIYKKDGAVFIENFSSSNITELCGREINAPMPLQPGDIITCGRVSLLVEAV